MRRVSISSLTLLGLAGLATSASAIDTSFNLARMEALNPSRLGQFTCRGLDTSSGTLEQRLKLAAGLAMSQQLGSGPMQLYSDILPADIPAPELTGMAASYFSQGLALAYGFNHKAAIRSFRNAQQADPDCALCYWGEALANGPNINAGMSSAENQSALAALKRAEALMPKTSPAGQALIAAQLLRYSEDGGDRAALDLAYYDAMKEVAARFPESDDIAVLTAEAAMNTSPWNYWDGPDQPKPQIAEAIALIEKVVARNPRHPQASHLYIHLVEATQPVKAEAAADRLAAGAAPGALGHLVHMPSHIYYRIGRYADSMKANAAAVRADEAYLTAVGDDGIYRYGYYPHNVHFLLTSAQMTGEMNVVVTEANKLTSVLNADIAREIPWIQAIHAAPAFAMTQYSSPTAILAVTSSPSSLAYVEAMRRYSRAVAHARNGDDAAFADDIAAMEQLANSPEVSGMVEMGFPAPDLVKMASLVAQGRKAHWDGEFDQAVSLFERAEAIEATIPYNEPPFWYYPIAQSRGAALYSAGRYEDARDAFRKAIFAAPNNSWALYGLAMTEAKLGNSAESRAAELALSKVWQGDVAWLQMERL